MVGKKYYKAEGQRKEKALLFRRLLMLKKKFRLLRETKFDKKNIYTSPFFVLRFTKNDSSFSRFGFVVSKKIDKRATIRNRVKRQVRVCIENNLDKIKDGYDLLF